MGSRETYPQSQARLINCGLDCARPNPCPLVCFGLGLIWEPAHRRQGKRKETMTTLTVRQFIELGYKVCRECHWTSKRPAPELLAHYQVFAVGYEKKGIVTPFALWLVPA